MTGVLRAALLVLALPGCLGVPAAVPVEDGPVDSEWEAIAVRVEPLVHPIDLTDRLTWRACLVGLDNGCEGRASGLGGSTGVEWEIDEHDFADPQALFWRFAVLLQQEESVDGEAARPLHVELAVTRPCGVLCSKERLVFSTGGSDEVRIEPRDIFLEPGETGLRLRVQPGDMATPSATPVRYTLQGYAAGFRAADEPILLS